MESGAEALFKLATVLPLAVPKKSSTQTLCEVYRTHAVRSNDPMNMYYALWKYVLRHLAQLRDNGKASENARNTAWSRLFDYVETFGLTPARDKILTKDTALI